MDLQQVATELYGISPDEFVARRTDLVKQSRAAKDRVLAKAVAELRKPTRSAWLVNLLAREAAAELEELLDLGAALRDAQQRLDGPQLRALSQQRSKAVNALARRAAELGAGHGFTATDANTQDVSQTLSGALAEPELAAMVRQGQLVQSVSYAGFGSIDLSGVAARPTLTVADRASAGESVDVDADQQRAAHEEAVAEAEAGLQRAEAEFAEAQSASDQATATADELAERIDELRNRLRETEAAEREAHEQARFARKKAQQLSQAVARAKANLDAIRSS